MPTFIRLEKLRDAISEAFTTHNFYVAITVSNVISWTTVMAMQN